MKNNIGHPPFPLFLSLQETNAHAAQQEAKPAAAAATEKHPATTPLAIFECLILELLSGHCVFYL